MIFVLCLYLGSKSGRSCVPRPNKDISCYLYLFYHRPGRKTRGSALSHIKSLPGGRLFPPAQTAGVLSLFHSELDGNLIGQRIPDGGQNIAVAVLEAPEGAVVRYSLLRLTDFDGTDPQPVECRVLAALEYAPGCAEPRSILAIRSPMAVAADGSAFEGQAFAALYSGRNFYCDLSGNNLTGKSYILWAGTDWITPDGQDTGYAPGTESRPDDRILAGESGTLTSARSVSCYQSYELFFPTLEK